MKPKNINLFGYDIEWYDNNNLKVSIKDKETGIFGEYFTSDFENFQLMLKLKEEPPLKSTQYISERVTKVAFTDNKDRVLIKYKNGEVWDTGLRYPDMAFGWSNDDKYAFGLTKEKEYVINTEKKEINLLNKYTSPGVWAPTKNLYAFYAGDTSRGFKEKGFYIFNAEDLSFTKLKSGDLKSFKIFIWSPNSRYLLVTRVSEMYLFDVENPSKHPKTLVSFKNNIDSRIKWSDDSKYIYFLFSNTTMNIIKPSIFYVAKLNIETGKMKKIFIDALLYRKFYWINDNLVYYTIDNEKGLLKSKLDW